MAGFNGAASVNGTFEVFDAVNGTGVFLPKAATSWAALSDERKKDIIEPITGALAKVATLRTVIGKYKTDRPDMRRPFLIAQDVLVVQPEAVDIQDDEAKTLSLRSVDLIPLLVAAIAEIKTQLDEISAVNP